MIYKTVRYSNKKNGFEKQNPILTVNTCLLMN